ncbi:MAG: BON domain-containing protein [Gammaproteobacteria bacterium]
MKISHSLMTVAVLALVLSGCILVVPNDGDSSHTHWHSGYNDGDKTDHDLAQAVRTSLDGNSQTRAAAISVNSHDGDVTLQGTVSDTAVLGQAVALAAGTAGVQKVICEIVVLKK